MLLLNWPVIIVLSVKSRFNDEGGGGGGGGGQCILLCPDPPSFLEEGLGYGTRGYCS